MIQQALCRRTEAARCAKQVSMTQRELEASTTTLVQHKMVREVLHPS